MSWRVTLLVAVLCGAHLAAQGQPMSEKKARETIAAMRVNGRVGGSLDFRVTSTDRSYNYKLRATWLTPQVLAAAGRILESAKGMATGDVQRLLEELTAEPAHYLLVELDPREGSGVIPRDWLARFGPKGVVDRQAEGRWCPSREAGGLSWAPFHATTPTISSSCGFP